MSSETFMAVANGPGEFDPYQHHLKQEKTMPHYRADRGIQFASWDLPPTLIGPRNPYVRNFDFNPFAYLRATADSEPDRRIEVLETGCGIGQALIDLKAGIYSGYPSVFYRGLDERIRTTGVTLNPEHAEQAAKANGKFTIDDLRVGPIVEQGFPVQFDFIYDFFGVGFYFPKEALNVYEKTLRAGGLAYTRFNRLYRDSTEDLIEKSDLELVAKGGYGQWDALLRKCIH